VALSVSGDALTLGRYLDEWLDLQRTQLQHSTWSSYGATVRRYVLPHLAHAPLTELTPADLNGLYAHLLDRGGADGRPLGVRSVGYVHAILHKAFEDAIAVDLLEANPTHRARPPRRTGPAGNGCGGAPSASPDAGAATPSVDIWTAAQLRVFLASVRRHELRELFVVAACTGLRRGELLGLAWDDVDLPGASLRVRQSLSVINGEPRLKPPKTGRVRTLHLDEATVEALHRQRQRQDDDRRAAQSWDNPWNLVFTGRTGRYHSPDSVSNRFRRAVDRAPVPGARLHHLRHLHATLLLQSGVPVKVVSERLGHATTQLTLDIYAHVLPAMDAEAVQRFAVLVLDEGRPGPTRSS
jgi:integrase